MISVPLGRHHGREAAASLPPLVDRPIGQTLQPEFIIGSGPILLLADHASNHVPDDIDLGINAGLLDRHIAIDIGTADLARALAVMLNAPAILATVSRLVIDLHRQVDHPGLVPDISDGHPIPGNVGVDRLGRVARFHRPYHAAIADAIKRHRPSLIASIHSFTPALETGSAPRPWEVGILYNRDTRAATDAMTLLSAANIVTGDNEPYSGRVLNATLNRHGEGNGIASFAIEVRNDLITTPAGVSHWCAVLAPIVSAIAGQHVLGQTAAIRV